MCGIHKTSWVLVLAGALNWGLVGLFKFNLVAAILGGLPLVERLVYVLVGVAAVMMLMKENCKTCKISVGDMKKKEETPAHHEGGHHEGGNMPPSGGMS
ncbi:DUF378 domain-containing protein [Patescibacteria group bacterium]|uniref:DUF378 domain-containing protein n=1 Tax=candidate division WWE3 bacterium TaxID=2053526 RepID=A0A928TSG9_UNCKA|nr:DUF378 domain-containing protein [candidate division WWE3 bacterium]MCL4732638.1 DUF378 domain-containing protein [Patescibacteria group bacterium]MDL1952708.1 DUF378 domain-containing protein [Candidatus Uhrbacteria bacterium UHB]RIL01305.1 MAG: hypothetical protein DCC77_01310 [Candidatus Uhrbacteria bacterium]